MADRIPKRLPNGKLKEFEVGLKVGPNTIARYVAMGMPIDSGMDAARDWRRANIRSPSGAGRQISETARLRRAQADLAELEARREAGLLMPVEEHEEAVKAILGTLATSFNGFGARHAGVLAGMTDAAAIRTYIDEQLDATRRAAAAALERLGRSMLDQAGRDDHPPASEDARQVG